MLFPVFQNISCFCRKVLCSKKRRNVQFCVYLLSLNSFIPSWISSWARKQLTNNIIVFAYLQKGEKNQAEMWNGKPFMNIVELICWNIIIYDFWSIFEKEYWIITRVPVKLICLYDKAYEIPDKRSFEFEYF